MIFTWSFHIWWGILLYQAGKNQWGSQIGWKRLFITAVSQPQKGERLNWAINNIRNYEPVTQREMPTIHNAYWMHLGWGISHQWPPPSLWIPMGLRWASLHPISHLSITGHVPWIYGHLWAQLRPHTIIRWALASWVISPISAKTINYSLSTETVTSPT